MEDLLGIGKVLPIEKLIDVISKALGKVSNHYFDRKNIDAKAYEIRKLAEARADEMRTIATAINANFLLSGGIEYNGGKIAISSPTQSIDQTIQASSQDKSLKDRAEERVIYQEEKKQENLEHITAFAAGILISAGPVTNQPVDEGWASRFFRLAEDISVDEMKALWGRILAGEIKTPGSFSLRTLELLKNLSKSEAECFIKVGRLAIESDNQAFVTFSNIDEEFVNTSLDITPYDEMLLQELNLLASQPRQLSVDDVGENDEKSFFFIGDTALHVTPVVSQFITRKYARTPIPTYHFTSIGKELLQLIDKVEPHIAYVQSVAEFFTSENFKVTYGKWIKENGKFKLLDAKEILFPELRKV